METRISLIVHRSSLHVEQSPLPCPPSSHPQTSLCSPLCGSEDETGMHKVISTTALPKWEARKSHREKGFPLHIQGWVPVGHQPLSQHTLLITHSFFFESTALSYLWSRALLAMSYIYKKIEIRKLKARLHCCIIQVGCELHCSMSQFALCS